MGEVNGRQDINIELSKLHSDKVDERSVGLIRLTQIIKEKRQDLKQVNDTGYHTILETVFRVVKLEGSNYARATKHTKPKVESRLSGCANLIRVVVEVGLRKLRYKTVKALIEHIIQTLPTADTGYCTPLCINYFKALATLLGFEAHPEHFIGDEWHEVVDFCLEAARDLNRSSEVNESGSTNGIRILNVSASRRDNPSRSATPSAASTHGQLSSFNASQPAAYPQIRDSQLEIAICLRHLISVPNVPISAKANAFATTLLTLLDSYPKVAVIQQTLFECINSLMSRIIANDVALALHIVSKTLPLFRRFWDVRDNTMKEPLLVLLSFAEGLLPRLINEDHSGNLKTELDVLVETLREDYCSRRFREQLQLDDLSPVDPISYTRSQIPLSNKTLQVRTGVFKAEQPWCLLASTAAVIAALEHATIARAKSLQTDEHDLPPKRQRLSHPTDDLFALTKSSTPSEKLYALKVLVFVFDKVGYDENALQGRLDMLLPCLSDDDGLIVSWAMFAMTTAARQSAARSSNLTTFWLKIWRLIARHITSSSTCRAACHFMTCLLVYGLTRYSDVVDIVDGMLRSVDLSGPAECDESAATLWTQLLIRRSIENFASTPDASENVLHWLFSRWSPGMILQEVANIRTHVAAGEMPDRQRAMHKAQVISPFSNLRLICTCLGLSLPSTWPRPAMNLGILSQRRLKILRDKKMMEYLLLAEEKSSSYEEDTLSTPKIESNAVRLSIPKFRTLASNVGEFLISNGAALLQHHFSSAAESINGVNREIAQICMSFMIVSHALLSNSKFQAFDGKGQLESILYDLSRGLKHCMLHLDDRPEILEAVFESFAAVLPPISVLCSRDDLVTNGIVKMSREFDQTFWRETLHGNDLASKDSEQGTLDLEDDFDSQRSQFREGNHPTNNTHSEVTASTNVAAFRAYLAAKICLMSNLASSQEFESSLQQASSSTISYLIELQGHEFLSCRAFILELLESGPQICEDDASTLLQYLAEVLLRSYEFERSEVSMGLILNVMTGLAELWTVDENTELSQMGDVFYSWFINTALKKAISSPHVHICMSTMLQKIIKVRPEYGKTALLPSARTSLFEVLRVGSIEVKFYIGSNIADIFGLFILKKHEHILEDVIESLPSDSNWIEGISLRLFILSHLAASWSTLLRRCIYAILECPRYIPTSAAYAEKCLTYITTSLKLVNTKDLFKLFVAQIFYTWLEAEPLRLFPYSIFGYQTLSDLLRDVRDEIVGQIVMRGKDHEADQLSAEMQLPFRNLLEISFGKASAYCIGRDVGMAPSKGSQAPNAELRMRKIFGTEYSSFIAREFSSILATFFKTMDPAGQMEKGFQKHAEAADAYSAYKDILSKSGPDKDLPASQQPSIRARYLLDEIEYLCRRANYDAEALWTPELYVYIFREIISSIHGALGSLYACSVLRKIRILISMAGNIALEQYPLEMALRSVKVYLTDLQCAEEAIGIVQYLFEHGASYLREVPSFMAGHAVYTLTSMKAFFDSTQDSTTQESQFQATMSRAQTFHTWFSAYLKGYESPHLTQDSARSFRIITTAASHIQRGGNAKLGTYESELLLEVLEDQRSGRELLDESSRESILNFLCASFEVPSSFRDDILGSDATAFQYAAIIWKTCQNRISSLSYRLWAGRVLGRAYAGNGLIDQGMTKETFFESATEVPSTQMATASSSSRANLLSLLYHLLHDEPNSNVGMAESTLRSIVSKRAGSEEFLEYIHLLPSSLKMSLLWRQFHLPDHKASMREDIVATESATEPTSETETAGYWIQRLCVALVLAKTDDPILSELAPILKSIQGLAEKAFPYILHLVLLGEMNGLQSTRRKISERCQQMFQECTDEQGKVTSPVPILLQAILYLRTQPLPSEASKDDRAQWLEIDYKLAAAAAIKCSMFKTALLFLEVDYSISAKMSRRSSAIKVDEPSHLLLAIYEKIDEQDAFYGVQQPSSLTSMMTRLEYEKAGFKSLSFRGAHYDGQIRSSSAEHQEDEESIVRALDDLDLNGLSQSLLNKMTSTGPTATDSLLRTARKLEQWDISAPTSHLSTASTLFHTFQGINSAADSSALTTVLDTGLRQAMDRVTFGEGATSAMHEVLGSLAVLTEADEIFSSRQSVELFEVIRRFDARHHWMRSESYEHIKGILSCRETVLSMLSKVPKLQDILKISQRDARCAESQLLFASSHTSRLHGALQNALSTATYLTQLVGRCEKLGIDISAAVKFESAHVLWGQGEMAASIKMLQELKSCLGSHDQFVKVGKPELLATLGHHISEARLEKPDEIINQYLAPAIIELHGRADGDEAGQVFHEFASFCDQQLQNPDGLEDFHRIRKLRERKEAEVEDLNKMMKSASSQARERDNLKSYRNKAKAWFDLDDREFQRLRESREMFLRQSLENYLLCLRACDQYDKDALRFSALWLENYDSDIANQAVAKYVGQVSSRKFASLMNQLSSRLLESAALFQTLLASLVLRICVDHPYHGMYQIFAGSKSKGGKDEKALARNAAANSIVQQLKSNKRSAQTWMAVHNTNICFVRFASERFEDSAIKPGSKVLLRKSTVGQRVEQDVQKQRIPPPTAKIELRADCDYSKIPLIARFQPEFTVASGISMPKILTAVGTDGLKYKQLFKGGNDDLRQDSIMEQVFEQVSNLLRAQRATRQRNLGIRTYKVLPLTATTGIIEFVPNTIPLHDYLLPAHQRHFPKDYKPNNCRKHISDVQNKSVDQRIKVFRQVCDHFHPVLRYFFMERFENPDDWFEKRLAYTRSTAAISILGHILGLGDRHGHNILLDEKTGEVVHIDLGIAFEQGRILPVPEVVPFRLTRDLVDAMGITKTEGVFRRCCEFTLEALRNESYSIVTILDVLRYDPLYSWSVSPLRLKKMQDAQTEDPKIPGAGGDGLGREAEPGEADRALTVVKKKLSKSLSVQATVNELIQMATDERNLAVLFCGWAAYA